MKRGQLSAEMLILLVLILALVAIVFSAMRGAAEKGAAGVEKGVNASVTASQYGPTCSQNSDCRPPYATCESYGGSSQEYCKMPQ